MNKTQRLHRELMQQIAKYNTYLSKNYAEYFDYWLLTNYKIGEYKDVHPLNVGQSDTNS